MTAGPTYQMPPGFCILEFPPRADRDMWTYATCGMSCQPDAPALELHLFSPESHDDHVELLTATAHYHLTGAYLGLGHTVNFGHLGSLTHSAPTDSCPSLTWTAPIWKSARFETAAFSFSG